MLSIVPNKYFENTIIVSNLADIAMFQIGILMYHYPKNFFHCFRTTFSKVWLFIVALLEHYMSIDADLKLILTYLKLSA